MYEVVGEGDGLQAGGNGGMSFLGGRYSALSSCVGSSVRAMRESLLRELRRDLSRFADRQLAHKQHQQQSGHLHLHQMGPGEGAGGVGVGGGEEKAVRVRPGLALGVITLQAGAAGPQLLLQ